MLSPSSLAIRLYESTRYESTRTTQKLADRIKQHIPTSIRMKSNAAREQPLRICKNKKSKMNCRSAIGQHLIANPECAKTYTDDNFRIIGQARSSFHLSVYTLFIAKPVYRQPITGDTAI